MAHASAAAAAAASAAALASCLLVLSPSPEAEKLPSAAGHLTNESQRKELDSLLKMQCILAAFANQLGCLDRFVHSIQMLRQFSDAIWHASVMRF